MLLVHFYPLYYSSSVPFHRCAKLSLLTVLGKNEDLSVESKFKNKKLVTAKAFALGVYYL